MNKQFLFPMILILLFDIFFNHAFAKIEKGDTLVIEPSDQNVSPFNEIITADTLADGTRKHLVYELVPNGIFSMSRTLTAANYNLNLVGGKRAGDDTRPGILVTNDFIGHFMISGENNITIKGIHLMQVTETEGGNIDPWARSGIELTGTDAKVVFHDMVWDFNTGFAFSGKKDGLNLKVTHCLFRFNKPLDNSVWTGQGFDIRQAELDTVIFQNCTWYGGGYFLVCTWESSQNLFQMDHCTVVDFVQYPIHGTQWGNTFFTNNLFYNTHTMGEDYNMRHSSAPDTLPYGIINIDTVNFIDFSNVDWEAEANRSVYVKNNNNFVSSNIKSYWNDAINNPSCNVFLVADPDFYDGFMNSRTQAMFANDDAWPNLILENTTSLDPEFADYFDYSDTLINYSKAFYSYAWPGVAKTRFMMDPDDGDPCTPTDPMFYDLKLTNETLRVASTSGGVIGDLTWEQPNGYNSTQAELTAINNETSKQLDNFTLLQNYPNPFNPATTISFNLPISEKVTLEVFNTLGQKITTILNNKNHRSGMHVYTFNGSQLPSGIYFYYINAGEKYSATKKMILLK